MEYNKWIADLAVSDEIEGYYVLKTAQIKKSRNDKPFQIGRASCRKECGS